MVFSGTKQKKLNPTRYIVLGFGAIILPVSYTHLTLPTTPYV